MFLVIGTHVNCQMTNEVMLLLLRSILQLEVLKYPATYQVLVGVIRAQPWYE